MFNHLGGAGFSVYGLEPRSASKTNTKAAMSDDIIQEFRYRVKKVTFSRKQCRVCGGTGKRNNKSGSPEPCLNCQNGVETVEHQTDVSLRTALEEIGIENLIRKTVAEMKTQQLKIEICSNKNCTEPVYEFGKCFKHHCISEEI